MVVKTPKGQNRERAIVTALSHLGHLDKTNCKGWGFRYSDMMSYFYRYFQPEGLMVQEWKQLPGGGQLSTLKFTTKGMDYYEKEGLIHTIPERGWVSKKPVNLIENFKKKSDYTQAINFAVVEKEVIKVTLGTLVKLLNAGTNVCVMSSEGYVAKGDFSNDDYYKKVASNPVKTIKVVDNMLQIVLDCDMEGIL